MKIMPAYMCFPSKNLKARISSSYRFIPLTKFFKKKYCPFAGETRFVWYNKEGPFQQNHLALDEAMVIAVCYNVSCSAPLILLTGRAVWYPANFLRNHAPLQVLVILTLFVNADATELCLFDAVLILGTPGRGD